MANIAALEVELNLDSGQFVGKLTQAGAVIKTFGRSINAQTTSIARMERRITGLGSKLRDTMVILGQLRGSMLTVWGATGAPLMGIVKVNAELERMQALMRGVASGTEAQRRAQAEGDFNFAIDLSKEAPFQVRDLADSMVKLRSSGIDPTTGSMVALTDAIAAFGGNDQTLHRATIALQQMAGKGVISMEELRQQLGEAVPSAIRLLARGAGMEMGDLVKEISKGTVEAKTAIQIMMREFAREYGGSAKEMMETWNGLVSRMKTQWFLFAKEIGDAGAFEAAKDVVRELSAALSNPQNLEMARQFGEALGYLITQAVDCVKWIIANREALMSWGKVVLSLMGARYLAGLSIVTKHNSKSFTDLFGILKKGVVSVFTFQKALRGMTVMGAISAATVKLGAALRGLLFIMTGASGPIGILVAGLTLVAGWIWKIKSDADQAKRSLQQMMNVKSGEMLEEGQLEEANAQIKTFQGHIEALRKMREKDKYLTGGDKKSRLLNIAHDMDRGDIARQLVEGKISVQRAWNELIQTNEEGQAKLQTSIRNHNETIRNNEIAKGVEERYALIEQGLDAELSKFEEYRTRLNEEEKMSAQERNVHLEANNQARLKALGDYLKEVRAQLTGEKMAAMSADEHQKVDVLEGTLKRVTDAYNEAVESARRMNEGPTELKLITPTGAKEGEEKLSAYQSKFAQLTEQIAKYRAVAEGTNPVLARLEELSGLDFGPASTYTEAELENLKKLAVALDEWQKKAKAVTDAARQGREAAENFADIQSKVFEEEAIANQRLSSGNFYETQTTSMMRLDRQLAVIRDRLQAAGTWTEEWAKQFDRVREAVNTTDVADFVHAMNEAADEDRIAAISNPRERALAELNRELEQIQRNLDKLRDADGVAPKAAEEAAEARVAAARARFNYENKSASEQMLDSWRDAATRMDELWADTMDNLTTSIVDMVFDGKSSFSDLVRHALKEFAKIQLQKGMAEMMSGASGWMGSLFGFADGGIMTSRGALPLKAYANGGIADRPQLALFGEGRMPEAYVPLPDGRTIPVTMKGGGGGIVNQTNITVQIASDGSATSSTDGESESQGRELGRMIQATVQDTLIRESRQGGLLWRMRQNGS